MSDVLINGAGGRIGRAVTREFTQLNENPPVALNEPRGLDFVVQSYKERDPVHGVYDWSVEKGDDGEIVINGARIAFFAEKEITKIHFRDLGIETVLECSGFYGDPKVKDKSSPLKPEDNIGRIFLSQGVKTVIETYPAATADATLVMGVNNCLYDPKKHFVISNASCTTKSLAMPLQVLIDNKIIVHGLTMDTTHAATASQAILESLGQIVTHSTGAAKATGLVIPELKGKMSGMAYRVPTLDGSFSNMNLTLSSKRALTAQDLNNIFTRAVPDLRYAGRFGVYEGKDAGTFDIVGRRENATVILSKTSLIELPFAPIGEYTNHYQAFIVSAYDNELGSSVDPVLLERDISKVNE